MQFCIEYDENYNSGGLNALVNSYLKQGAVFVNSFNVPKDYDHNNRTKTHYKTYIIFNHNITEVKPPLDKDIGGNWAVDAKPL